MKGWSREIIPIITRKLSSSDELGICEASLVPPMRSVFSILVRSTDAIQITIMHCNREQGPSVATVAGCFRHTSDCTPDVAALPASSNSLQAATPSKHLKCPNGPTYADERTLRCYLKTSL